MNLSTFSEGVKVNLERYGAYSWFILFGFVVMIFSIIHRPEYVALGVYFTIYGILGFALTTLMDHFSKIVFNGHPGIVFYVIYFLLSITLVLLLGYQMQAKYGLF